MGVAQGEKEKEDGPGLWESILNEVAHAARMPDSTVLLLGRAGIGKRTLVQALLAHACPAAAAADASADNAPEGHSRDVAVDYAYFGVRDPSEDDLAGALDYVCPAACSVLILEDVRYEKLLRNRLTAGSLRQCAAVVCVDLKEPWTMMEDLRRWTGLLQRILSELMQQLPLGQQDELRARTVDVMANYKEPGEPGTDGAGAAESVSGGGPAPAYNLGIPLVVVVTRADGATSLDTQKTLGWSETIEAYLRSECLNYGAAIVYTMVQTKKNTNVDVLYDYLMHRLYGFPFSKGKPCVHSRDALFVPSGWDSQAKVDQVAAALPGGGLEHSFESVVVCLDPPAAAHQAPDECEDMQTFLKHHAVVLKNLGGTFASGGARRGQGSEVCAGSAAGTRRSMTMMEVSSATGSKRGTAESVDRGGGGNSGAPPATDNSALASFFQNLLVRGQGSASGGTTARSSLSAANAPAASPAAHLSPGASSPEAAAAAPLPAAAAPAVATPEPTSAAAGAAAAGGAAATPVVSLRVPVVPPAAQDA